jgi:hypothetical protein
MSADLAARIEYSEKYNDDRFEYRCVVLFYGTTLKSHVFSLSLSRSTHLPRPRVSHHTIVPLLSRHVILPKALASSIPKKKLLSEQEWRGIGVQQSRGWVHYAIHR